MADDITVKIGAKDNASKTLDSIQKKADKLDEEKVELTVEAKVTKALGALDSVAAQAKKVQAAADALGAALGPELAGRMDLSKAIRDFQRMDLSLEDIVANADKLGGKLKEIDDQNIGGKLSGGFGRAKDDMKGLHTEADQSRSVLANLAGNATQDLGQLGGVAGTAGVAIGQLAEYATEGNIALSGLAAAAGPMAGLLVIGQAVSETMKIFAQRTQQAKDDTTAWAKAMSESGDAASNMAHDLADAGKILADTSDHTVTFGKVAKATGDELFGFGNVAKDTFKLLTGGFKPVKDITERLAKAGISVEQYTKSIAGGVVGAEQFQKALAETNLSSEDQKDLMNALVNGQRDYQSAAKNSAAAAKVFGDATEDTADSQKELEKNLQNARDAWEEHKKEVENNSQAVADYQQAINSVDWKMAGLSGATKGLEDFASAQFEATDAIIGVETSIDDFSKSLKDTKQDMKGFKFNFDLATDAGRKNQKAMEELASAIDKQLAPAFADSHGDLDTFMKDAKRITDQSLAELKKEFGLTDDQVAALKTHLGETAQDWEAKFKLSMDQEAIIKLQLLQGVISALDKPTQQKIALDIIAGNPQQALADAQTAINNLPPPSVTFEPAPPSTQQITDAVDQMQLDINQTPGPDVPLGASVSAEVAADGVQQMQAYINNNPNPTVVVSLDTTEALRKIKALRDFIQKNYAGVIDLPPLDQGGTAGGMGGIAGERGPEILNSRYLVTQPTYIPPGTRVTSRKRTEQILRTRGTRGLKRYDSGGIVPRATSVTINAAVIGSTFDVMNAVNTAVRRAERLLPRHQ